MFRSRLSVWPNASQERPAEATYGLSERNPLEVLCWQQRGDC